MTSHSLNVRCRAPARFRCWAIAAPITSISERVTRRYWGGRAWDAAQSLRSPGDMSGDRGEWSEPLTEGVSGMVGWVNVDLRITNKSNGLLLRGGLGEGLRCINEPVDG